MQIFPLAPLHIRGALGREATLLSTVSSRVLAGGRILRTLAVWYPQYIFSQVNTSFPAFAGKVLVFSFCYYTEFEWQEKILLSFQRALEEGRKSLHNLGWNTGLGLYLLQVRPLRTLPVLTRLQIVLRGSKGQLVGCLSKWKDEHDPSALPFCHLPTYSSDPLVVLSTEVARWAMYVCAK